MSALFFPQSSWYSRKVIWSSRSAIMLRQPTYGCYAFLYLTHCILSSAPLMNDSSSGPCLRCLQLFSNRKTYSSDHSCPVHFFRVAYLFIISLNSNINNLESGTMSPFFFVLILVYSISQRPHR